MALIVEVLNPRTGAVVTRQRVASLPFTIGRALDNALVLEDPHVDARHAAIVADPESGDLVAEDLGSVNGIQTIAHPRADLVRLRSGAEIRLGRTTLRFRDEADPLPPAVPLHGTPRTTSSRWHEHGFARFVFSGAVFALIGWMAWLDTAARSGTMEALGIGLAMAGMTALWAGIWAIVARMIIHQSRFLTHLAIAAFFMLLTTLLALAGEWVDFLWPDAKAWAALYMVVSLGLLSASVALHLANSTHLSRLRRWRAGVVVSVVLIGFIGLFALADDDGFTDVPSFSARIQPLLPRLVPKLDPDGMRREHASLREAVDKLVDRPE